MCNRAQWEIRELADDMYRQCSIFAPVLFENCGAGCMTTKGCPEGKRSCKHPRTKEEVLG
jgi:thymidylate synthase (FAD)